MVALLLAMLAGPALAAEEHPLAIELNKAVTAGTGCRLTFVAENGTGSPIEKNAYEMAVFDADKRVKRLLVFEFGAMSAGKSKVVEFNFPDLACEQISRILVNTAQECTVANAPSTLCLDRLTATSRLPILFGP